MTQEIELPIIIKSNISNKNYLIIHPTKLYLIKKPFYNQSLFLVSKKFQSHIIIPKSQRPFQKSRKKINQTQGEIYDCRNANTQ